jgi:hypothetical protein
MKKIQFFYHLELKLFAEFLFQIVLELIQMNQMFALEMEIVFQLIFVNVITDFMVKNVKIKFILVIIFKVLILQFAMEMVIVLEMKFALVKLDGLDINVNK